MMLKRLKSLFKKDAQYRLVLKQARDDMRYEEEKRIARSDNVMNRMALAKNPKTHQEILFYLAQNDPDPGIRKEVARNQTTPVQASAAIAEDKSEDVRLALAERLVHLLPELSKEDHSQLYAIAVQALGALALDEVLKIRKALSSALKDHAYAPPAVVSQLARDVERQVAEPILRFCTALPDEVLLEILRSTPDSWAVQAIAGRKKVREVISVAVIETNDAPGGRVLLSNEGAEIGPELYKEIVRRARELPEWQKPLALRKGLPANIAKELSEFAHESVRDILIRRGDFDRGMTEEISRLVKRRLTYAVASETAKERSDEKPYDRAVRLAKNKQLDEKIIADALAMREEEFVIAALACLAQTSLPSVKRIFSMQAAKPVVALSWRAGLSMRMALQLQKDMARVPVKELIYPRNGTDYPLSKDELVWQLEFLGLQAA